MLPAYILDSYKRVLAVNGTPVAVSWLEGSGGVWDVTRKIWVGETSTPKTLTVPCQFYAANYGDTRLRKLAEEKAEHALFDFPGDALGGLLAPQAGSGESLPGVTLVTTEGKRISGIVFTVNGRKYVPSEAGRALTDTFDTIMAGVVVVKVVICQRSL